VPIADKGESGVFARENGGGNARVIYSQFTLNGQSERLFSKLNSFAKLNLSFFGQQKCRFNVSYKDKKIFSARRKNSRQTIF
jgi:hypothetical protein